LRKAIFVIIWAIAFAYVEAAVVEYLRGLYYPPDSGGFKFPLLTLDQIMIQGREHWLRLVIELGRELSTLAMLATVAIVAARNTREWWGYFMVAFGVWDLFYYVWLKVFLDWPASLMTWDLLFLVPVPWVSPVLAPVIVALAMTASGLTVLFYEARGQALVTSWLDWTFLTIGGVIVIVSFCMDYENIIAGGLPAPFNWPLFLLGLLTAVATFILILRRNRSGEHGGTNPEQLQT
jgi:hypothetical protein